MKRFFHSELETFRSNIVLMGQKSLEIVRLSLNSLLDQDPAKAEQVLVRDDEIDRLEMVIDSEAIRYISLRGPVAGELRLLTVGMKVGHDLERVGDESCSIARRVKKLSVTHPYPELDTIPEMAELAIGMLSDAVESFLEGNEAMANGILARDKQVDQMNREVYARLSDRLTAQPRQIPATLDLIFVAKSIERIADHATNIAEEVVYLMRGQDIRHSQEIKDFKKA